MAARLLATAALAVGAAAQAAHCGLACGPPVSSAVDNDKTITQTSSKHAWHANLRHGILSCMSKWPLAGRLFAQPNHGTTKTTVSNNAVTEGMLANLVDDHEDICNGYGPTKGCTTIGCDAPIFESTTSSNPCAQNSPVSFAEAAAALAADAGPKSPLPEHAHHFPPCGEQDHCSYLGAFIGDQGFAPAADAAAGTIFYTTQLAGHSIRLGDTACSPTKGYRCATDSTKNCAPFFETTTHSDFDVQHNVHTTADGDHNTQLTMTPANLFRFSAVLDVRPTKASTAYLCVLGVIGAIWTISNHFRKRLKRHAAHRHAVEAHAAANIQAVVRGQLLRKQTIRRMRAATIIQRKSLARLAARAEPLMDLLHGCAAFIAAHWLGFMVRRALGVQRMMKQQPETQPADKKRSNRGKYNKYTGNRAKLKDKQECTSLGPKLDLYTYKPGPMWPPLLCTFAIAWMLFPLLTANSNFTAVQVVALRDAIFDHMTEIEFTLRGSAGFIRGSFTSLGQDYLDIIRRAVAAELKCPGVSLRERHHGWSDATYTTTAFARAFNAYLVNVIEHLKDRSSNRKPLTLPAPSWFENNTFFSDDEGFNVSIMDGLMDLDDAHGTDHLSFCHGEEDLPQDDTESDSDDDLGLFNYLRHGGA